MSLKARGQVIMNHRVFSKGSIFLRSTDTFRFRLKDEEDNGTGAMLSEVWNIIVWTDA